MPAYGLPHLINVFANKVCIEYKGPGHVHESGLFYLREFRGYVAAVH